MRRSRESRQVASPQVVCVEDLRRLARRRVPRAVFDYIDGGAEGEVTLRENCRAFEDVIFRPRQAAEVAGCNLRTRVLGLDLSLPFVLAPVGYSRLMSPGGEVASARQAGQAGTAYILSTISGYRLEDVKAASPGPVFYQLYLMGGRASAEAAIERARLAGYAGLVVTIELVDPGRTGLPVTARQGGNAEPAVPDIAAAVLDAAADAWRIERGGLRIVLRKDLADVDADDD